MARLWPEVERRLVAWDLPPPRTALDYGCGVGRIAQALADCGLEVTGLDLSPRMVGLAERWNRHPGRCRYAVASDAAPDGAPFDLIYCALVLQHVPPREAARTLAGVLRWLSPQGMAAVQVVTGPAATGTLRRRLWQRLPRGAWRAFYRLRGEADLARVPLWPLPLRRARQAVRAAGCQLREVEANGMAGLEWRSAWLWITGASR